MPCRSAIQFRQRVRWLVAASIVACMTTGTSRADFTTIINVPPNIGDNQAIGSNTQVNMTGGSIGLNFDAGNSDGTSSNIEVNISAGNVGNNFDAYKGSVANISGGVIGSSLRAFDGSVVNVSGGYVGAQM